MVLRDDTGETLELELAVPLSSLEWAATGRELRVRYGTSTPGSHGGTSIEVTDLGTGGPLLHAVHTGEPQPTDSIFGIDFERRASCLFTFVQPSALAVWARDEIAIGDVTLAPWESAAVPTPGGGTATFMYWYGEHRPGPGTTADGHCWSESAIGLPEPLAYVVLAEDGGAP